MFQSIPQEREAMIRKRHRAAQGEKKRKLEDTVLRSTKPMERSPSDMYDSHTRDNREGIRAEKQSRSAPAADCGEDRENVAVAKRRSDVMNGWENIVWPLLSLSPSYGYGGEWTITPTMMRASVEATRCCDSLIAENSASRQRWLVGRDRLDHAASLVDASWRRPVGGD